MSYENLHGYNQPNQQDSTDPSGGPKKTKWIKRNERKAADPKQDIILPDVQPWISNGGYKSIPEYYSEDTTYLTYLGKKIYFKKEYTGEGVLYKQARGYCFIVPWDGIMNPGVRYNWDKYKGYALNLDGTRTPWGILRPYPEDSIQVQRGSKLENYNCVYTYQLFCCVIDDPEATYVSTPPANAYIIDEDRNKGVAGLWDMMKDRIAKHFSTFKFITVDTNPKDTSTSVTRKFNGRYIGTSGKTIEGSKKKYPICILNAEIKDVTKDYSGKVMNFNTPPFKSFKEYVEYCIKCQNSIDWEVENDKELTFGAPFPAYADWYRFYRYPFTTQYVKSFKFDISTYRPIYKDIYPLSDVINGPSYGLLHGNLVSTTYLKEKSGSDMTYPLFTPWFGGVAMCLNFGGVPILSMCEPKTVETYEGPKIEHYDIPFGSMTNDSKWVYNGVCSNANEGRTYSLLYGLLWSTKLLPELNEESDNNG